jgi:uncharacterized protein (TIGR04255 family)
MLTMPPGQRCSPPPRYLKLGEKANWRGPAASTDSALVIQPWQSTELRSNVELVLMIYRRPPITEVALDFRFAHLVEQRLIEKAGRRFEQYYQNSRPEEHVNVNIEVPNNPRIHTQWLGLRLSTNDQVDITLLRVTNLICSRLAPYPGWDAFEQRARRDWETLRRDSGFIEVSRIGLRYINRIDIPANESATFKIEDYVTTYPHMPETKMPPMTGYAMQIIRPVGAYNLGLILNSAIVPSPLIGFVSVVLDIDIYREAELPKRDEGLWEIINKMRIWKNLVFEGCVTDRAREIFQPIV